MYDPLKSRGVSPFDPQPNSYWHHTHTCRKFESLKQNISTDYLIIGGGYTGLSAAITFAEADKNTTVIDANTIGFGCAGRNGGFVLSGSGRLSLSAIEEKWDQKTAKGMQAEFDGAVALLKQRINKYDMQVDWCEGAYYKLAHSKKSATMLHHAAQKQAADYGVKSTCLSQADIQDRFAIAHTYGGVKVDGACLHPLKLIDEYARVAENFGAALYYNTPALEIEKTHNWFEVSTPNTIITAKHVVIASNAYTPKRFHEKVDNKQFPVQSSIFVTAPLSESQKNACGLTSPMSFMDTRMMKYYYRVLPDGRLLFGGRGAVSAKGSDSNSEKQRLYNAMAKSFPALKGIAMDYFWSGWVSVSFDDMPRIFADTQSTNKLGYAMGYCGSGVSFAAFAGMRLAQRMMGQENFDTTLPLYSSPLPSFPFPAFRRLALHGLYQWAKVAER